MKRKINKDMQYRRFELKNTHPEYSDYQLDEIIKEEKKEVKDEIWEYIAEFMTLFKQDNLDDAIEYVNFLKEEIKYYPQHLVEYLKDNFFPEYRKYLRFLEEDYKEKLECTNNKLENFNGNTMPKFEKKTYRTRRGLWSALMHKNDGWIIRRNEDLTS